MIELNIYILYELRSNLNNFDFTSANCLFGAVKLTRNANIDKYKYLGCGIGFNSKETFLFPDGSFAQTVIIFGADMSSSAHANNNTRSILVLGKDFIQGIDGTTIHTEKIYSTNVTLSDKKIWFKFVL